MTSDEPDELLARLQAALAAFEQLHGRAQHEEALAAMEQAGIKVDAQESHWVDASEHSAAYLAVKNSKDR